MSTVLPVSPALSPVYPRRADCRYLSRLLIWSSQGDQAAFTVLYDETCAVVYALALGLVGSAVAADELTHAVYLAAWTRAASYQEDEVGALTWILMLVRSCADERLCLDTVSVL